MVENSSGQLYTIEGFAAALIMLVTAWIVLGSTTIYTPGDSHISDMQLEQLGTDVLNMMDTPENATYTCTKTDCSTGKNNPSGKSALETLIENKYGTATTGPVLFNNMFLSYCNNKTDGTTDHIQYNASVYYRTKADNQTRSYVFYKSRALTPGDHAIRAVHWILVDNTDGLSRTVSNEDVLDHRPQEVLIEVLIWRG